VKNSLDINSAFLKYCHCEKRYGTALRARCNTFNLYTVSSGFIIGVSMSFIHAIIIGGKDCKSTWSNTWTYNLN